MDYVASSTKSKSNFICSHVQSSMVSSSSNNLCWRQVNPQPSPAHPFRSFRTTKRPKGQPRRRNVCGACIVADGHVLLVKQRELSKWGFPKGTREVKESKQACMMRELYEETGIRLKNIPHEFLFCRTFFESTIYFFKMDKPRTDILHTHDAREIEDVSWVSLDQLTNLSLNRVTNYTRRFVFSRPEWIHFFPATPNNDATRETLSAPESK